LHFITSSLFLGKQEIRRGKDNFHGAATETHGLPEAAMTRMERLKRAARETASRLDHRLGRFRPSVITAGPPAPSQRPAAVAICEICGAIVVVDQDPPPDASAMTGEGVSRRCKAIQQEGHEMA
jgi:hypothetical protein